MTYLKRAGFMAVLLLSAMGAPAFAAKYECAVITEAEDVRRLCRPIADSDPCPSGAQCWSCSTQDFYSPCSVIVDNINSGVPSSGNGSGSSGGGSGGGSGGDGSDNDDDGPRTCPASFPSYLECECPESAVRAPLPFGGYSCEVPGELEEAFEELVEDKHPSCAVLIGLSGVAANYFICKRVVIQPLLHRCTATVAAATVLTLDVCRKDGDDG